MRAEPLNALRSIAWAAATVCLAIVVAVLAWVGYSQQARAQRETRTPQALDRGQGRWIEVKDASIHVREWGPKEAPIVLLVHGTGGWSGAWFELPDALSRAGWQVVALDLPPFGLSTVAPDLPAADRYTRQAQARRILAVIDSLGAPVVLAAHSFGSGPSLEAAMHAQGLLRRLVLIDPALGLGPNGESPVCEPTSAFSSVLSDRSLRTAFVASTFTSTALTKPLLRSFVYQKASMTSDRVAAYQLPFERVDFTPQLSDYVVGFLQGNCEAANSLDMSKVSQWAASAPPVALLWGSEDTVTPVAQGLALKQRLEGATLQVIPEAGHIPHVERPAELASALTAMLRQQR